MVLIDTSVWVDHLRSRDDGVASLLHSGQVLMHPFVVGELSLGNLQQRDIVLASLQDLPGATLASDREVLHFIGQHQLAGNGIGYVDAHLLASVMLSVHAKLWTRDKRLARVAADLNLTAQL